MNKAGALDDGEVAGTNERAREFFWILVDVSGFGFYLLIIRWFLCLLVRCELFSLTVGWICCQIFDSRGLIVGVI